MQRFATLYSTLDANSGTSSRVAALAAYFEDADAADAAWALHVLLGKQGKRLITGRRLRHCFKRFEGGGAQDKRQASVARRTGHG